MRSNPVFTVLLIDDDTQHLKLQARTLSKAGFRTITTVVGSNIVGFHEHERPDAILLDYRLNSDLSSAQIASLIRQTFPHTPILLMSNLPSMPQDIAPLVDGFISKGDDATLIAALMRLLRLKGAA
ncbi:MAG: hypothetical protein DMG65_18300 [Candidatus Angelobacter sp. Gp1-AA117]|nr:MAG: hypothetical protein DMG65_18300 [Candidatus Angelobacter sp. Gp1-AA117]